MSNIYYHPEKCGLELLDVLEEPLDYEFNMLGLWRETSTGKMYWAQDSGCSCPTPFDDYCGVSNMTPLANVYDYSVFEKVVRDFPVPLSSRTRMLRKVSSIL
jgi:hypothetical protein